MLENYAIDIAFYCSIDTLRLQELLIKRNIIGDYIQLAAILCDTIFNIFLNRIGTLVLNTYEVKDEEINEPVANLDVNSFYPNAIIQNNIDLSIPVDNEYDDPSLIIVSDKEEIYRKFLPHYNNEEKMRLMPLMYKKLLSERLVAKMNMKKYRNNNILLSYWTAKSNV
ncbi:DNA/RNA polymerase [Gigaspora margarita]|uniref:DNA/RNA polymerase n=1 Tax=Gigaspora margarita TaxID=4874 RepID=A0A8H4AR06_GIGMA|nr:DNA/RNA polymerase [Gigaspora margarita]